MLGLFFPAFVFSQTVSAEVYSTISGHVLEAGTNNPVAGQAVTAVKMDSEETLVLRGVTNEKGLYVLEGATSGTYLVDLKELFRTGYYSEKNFNEVVVVAGKNIVNNNFTVKKGASISGRVLKGDKTTPYVGVRVKGLAFFGEKFFRIYGKTNENGFYKINGMPDTDNAAVVAEVPGAAAKAIEGISLVGGEETKNQDIVVVKDASTFSVKGRVVSAISNEGIGKVSIFIANINLDAKSVAVVSTDANGCFEVYGLQPGKYDFNLMPMSMEYESLKKEGVELKEGETPLEIEFKLTLSVGSGLQPEPFG